MKSTSKITRKQVSRQLEHKKIKLTKKNDQNDLASLVQSIEKKIFFSLFRILKYKYLDMQERPKKRTQTNFQHSGTTRVPTMTISRKTNPAKHFTKIALWRNLAARKSPKLVCKLNRACLLIWTQFHCPMGKSKKKFFFEIFSFSKIFQLSGTTGGSKIYRNDQ